MPNHGTFELPENDHLADMVDEALQRFAEEDGCTPAMWAGRAVRSTVVARLTMESYADGQDTLSAQRRPPGAHPVAGLPDDGGGIGVNDE